MVGFSRRTLLKAGAVVGAYGVGLGLAGGLRKASAAPVTLTAGETEALLKGSAPTKGIMSWNAGPMPPLLRLQKGKPFSARLVNQLKEPTTIHWHGLRIDNKMDGVPFLTQPYVYTGDTFDYTFTPPDAGTFWYHPHCNTLVQMGRGMTGMLIVENPDDPSFDDEIVLNLRDWRLGGDGQFIDQFKPRDAAKSGTYGTYRTANWQDDPVYDVPAGGIVRVRVCITDVTRIYTFGVDGAEATVIALDGNPVAEPFRLDRYQAGPGQRIELAMRMPETEGEIATLTNYRTTPPYPLARFRAKGVSLKRNLADVKALPANPVSEPVLKDAEVIPLELTATAENAPVKESFCGSLGYNFWAINKVPWGGDSDPTAPLAELKLGKTYILRLANRTPHAHPIHLHGMSFKVLSSTSGLVRPIFTDTYLVQPDEIAELGLVADNPGDWVIHCHIIEHQKSGMTAFLRVA
jgi:FtsP/CotA-like multicopper oxidase with cupredoxin domain